MTEKELEQTIEKLKTSNSTTDAFLGIYQYGGGSDESFIKTNEAGLMQLACELLSISLDYKRNEEGKINYHFDNEQTIDESSETFISYFEITQAKNALEAFAHEKPPKETLQDKVISMGCIAIVIIVVIATLIGFVQIISFFF